MPQNTPMKRQFTTIDGRTVMSNLPQHWGGNDWKITGVDNPLPVGNYVQTKSGVWIPQKGSDDGAADVRVTGSIVELIEGRVVESKKTNNLWIGASEYDALFSVYGIDVSKYRYLNLLVANYTERPIVLRRIYFGTQRDMRDSVNRPLSLSVGDKLIEPDSHILVGNSESLEFEDARAFEVALPYFAFHLFRGTSEVMGEGTIEFKLFGIK